MSAAIQNEVLDSIYKIIGREAVNPHHPAIEGRKPLSRLEQTSLLSRYFSSFFEPVVEKDNTDEITRTAAMNIRHQVFSEELGLEPEVKNKIETDEFDAYSIACLIKHIRTQTFAGTVRIIKPNHQNQLLPIQKYCLDAITDMDYHPSKFSADQICEISRLAVPETFRKRKIDKFDGAETGNINAKTFSDVDLRFFPLIAISLYLSATAQTLKLNAHHVYVMVEPRLAKSMSIIGIKFKQIGPIVKYHGRRAPFYIDASSVREGLAQGYQKMLDDFTNALS